MPTVTPIVTVEGGPALVCDPGRKLVLCLEDGGVDVLHRCGGLAKCTTCRVEVLEGDAGPVRPREMLKLAEKGLSPETRLACQVLVQHDLVVRVINRLSTSTYSDPGPRPDEQVDEEIP